jgi:hypothetical protein
MNETLKTLFSAQSRKAWGAGIVTFFTSLQLAIGEGGTLGDVTQYEWLGVAIATFGAFTATYSLSNEGAPGDLFGPPLPKSDVQYIKQLEWLAEELKQENLQFRAAAAKNVNRVDSSSSAPATMNTVKASDV